jgi:hypothetical protein
MVLLLGLCACGKRVGDGTQRIGSIELSVDGRGAVWPPEGEGCERLVECCETLAGLEGAMALGCQLAAAKGGTCAEMQALAIEMYSESSRAPLPAVCADEH